MADDNSIDFLPSRFLHALGNLAAYWAYLESATEVTIWAFLAVPRELGVAVTTHMGMVSRLQALSILASREFTDRPIAATEFQKLLDRIEQARLNRNKFIHAFWRHEKDASLQRATFLRISAKGVFKETAHTVDVAEIVAATDETNELTTQLQAFVEAAFPNAYVPWQRTEIEEDDPL